MTIRPDEVITDIAQITAEWLTRVLTGSGALDGGAVESFTTDITRRELSTNVRLTLDYTQEADGDLPRKLFLKMVVLDMEDEFFGPSEVDYYIRDYVGVADVPIPRSYDAAYSEELGRYHVLMDDFAETHVPSHERPPTLEHGLALAEGLAAMHAHWWGRERLEQAGQPIHTAEEIQRFVSIAEPGAGHILAGCADELQPHWPDAIRDVYTNHPRKLAERTANGSGFTLIHGDANLSNVLIPLEGHRPIYIIDRQPFNWSLTTWLGVYDLAYTLVLKWDAEIRRELEQPILRYYHDQLVKRGVDDYSWEQLYADYRLVAPMGIYVATEWCRGRLSMRTYSSWMPMLQRSMTAFDDLNCSALW